MTSIRASANLIDPVAGGIDNAPADDRGFAPNLRRISPPPSLFCIGEIMNDIAQQDPAIFAAIGLYVVLWIGWLTFRRRAAVKLSG